MESEQIAEPQALPSKTADVPAKPVESEPAKSLPEPIKENLEAASTVQPAPAEAVVPETKALPAIAEQPQPAAIASEKKLDAGTLTLLLFE